jgi:carnitine-CoA ligase
MYSGIDDTQRWVLPLVLEEQAATRGDQPFVSMTTGETLTYRALRDQAAQVAALLQKLGAGAGDHIAVMLPNGLDIVRAWAGIGRLGGVTVMLNSELTQYFLAHPLFDAQPRVLIIHTDYLDRLESIDAIGRIDKIVVVGPATDSLDARYERFDGWRECEPVDAPFARASDLACIMYTSGTTGPPKGVLMPHAHCLLFGMGVVDNLGVSADDHYYITLPLFHANGLLMQLAGTLLAGARATVRERFSASAWLDDVRGCGATITHSLGAISAFIIGQPPRRDDRDHSLRLILCAPSSAEHERVWRERFGIRDVVGAYGMTEVNIPLYGQSGHSRPGTCGRPYDKYFEVTIRDPETDFPVPVGHVGEIMVRPRIANCFMSGYQNQPEKTVEAWRNLWFHTGDAGRMDTDGYVTFIDRIKDCIRRRGENISTTDVESVFIALPGVAEIAAFGVSSDIEGGEDEIMLAVVPRLDEPVTVAAIVDQARSAMPRFARPRYLQFMPSLPRTGTEKVLKATLKASGVTPSTVDLGALY